MTKKESQVIQQAIMPVHEFCEATDKDAKWHDQERALMRQAMQRIAALEDEPKPEKSASPANETTTKGKPPIARPHGASVRRRAIDARKAKTQ